jgi:hydrogenase expression/formation protein HypE
MMPCDDEKQMKTILREIQQVASELHIDIINGQTEISEAFARPAVTVTMLGKKLSNKNDIKNVTSGMDIVMCGHAGIMGTVISVHENYDKLLTRYSEDYLRTAIRCENLIKLENQADIMLDNGALYTHDISSGGVYGALWELAEKYNIGIDISHDAIPILQETIEICEFTGENPYMTDGSGGVLCIIEDGEQLVEELYSKGYEANIIGRTTSDKARTITHDEEQRYLAPR